jgi:hypothetical protein
LKVEAFNFRWNEELVCQRRLHGEKGDYDRISDDESENEYAEEKNFEYNDLSV